MPSSPQRLAKLTLSFLTVLWLGTISSGVSILWTYALTPGKTANPLSQWPAETALLPGQNTPTLIVFIHPQCPCSRATIRELAGILAHCQGKIDTQVAIYKPLGSDAAWEQTDLRRAAEEIPGVKIVLDLEGADAKRFSATTSGHTLLFDRDGTLIFGGGITSARGHEGLSIGRSCICNFLIDGKAEPTAAPVYGCPLYESISQSR